MHKNHYAKPLNSKLSLNIKGYRVLIYILVFSVILMVSFCFNRGSTAETTDYGFSGNGTKENPYLISNADDMVLFSQLVNKGYSFDYDYFALAADIDLEGVEWIPIGIYDEGNYFYGCLDGKGHVIRNIHCNATCSGLFGILCGTVKNLGVTNGSFTGYFSSSIAASGIATAKIINCFSEADVYGIVRAGGLTDKYSGHIILSVYKGNLTCDTEDTAGICSLSQGSTRIWYCYTTHDKIADNLSVGVIESSRSNSNNLLSSKFLRAVHEKSIEDGIVDRNDIPFVQENTSNGIVFRNDEKIYAEKTTISVLVAVFAICLLILFYLDFEYNKRKK